MAKTESISIGTTIILKEIKFGGLVLNDVRASVVESQNAPLLLGQTVLQRLGKIEIDNTNRVLKITTNQ
jgi:predicted aspartyl protease